MIAESSDIRFECHTCGQHLVVEAAGAGLKTDCPICNTSVVVPPNSRRGDRKNAEEPRRAGLAKAAPFADPPADDLKEELIDASLLNGKLLADLNKAREESARLQQQLKSRSEEQEHLHASTTHIQAELKAFQTERAQMKSEMASLRQRLTAADEQLAAARTQAEEWKALAEQADLATAELKARLKERETALLENGNAAAAIRTQATRLEEKNAALEQALAEAHQKREELTSELAASRREIADFQARASQRTNDLQTTRNRVKELETALANAREQATRVEGERADLKKQLENAGMELAGAAAVRADLERVSAELVTTTDQRRRLEDEHARLKTRSADMQREIETLRRDLAESNTGRELIEVRDLLESVTSERDRALTRMETLETDLRSAGETETALRAELARALAEREEAQNRANSIEESRFVQDNEVLRGIVARLNGEITQRTSEVHRLKRARYVLKLAYVAFGIGLLGAIMLALTVLPKALR